MKLEEKHLKLASDKFNEVKKNKCNVLDGIFQYMTPGIDNLILKYVDSLFDSYDFLKNKYPKHIKETWDNFYKLLGDNIGKSENELSKILYEKYGIAW